MGQELSVGLGPQNIPALAPVQRVPGKTVWRPLDAQPAVLQAPAPSRAPSVTGAIVDVAWSAVAATDPEQIIATVRAERMASWGGFDHPHAPSGCGYCRRAAAVYR